MMTALNTEGRPSMPAFEMAMTKGEATASTVLVLEELWLVVRYQKPNNGKGDDVKQCDAPEDLLDSSGKRLAGIGCLSCSKADEFSSREGESGIDEDAAQSFEAIVKWTWIPPVCCADIAALWTSTYVDDDSQNDEAYHCRYLDDGEDELGFTIAFDSKKIDDDDQYQEDSHPSVVVDCSLVPIFDRKCRSDKLQW
jgi:hypothetical protein